MAKKQEMNQKRELAQMYFMQGETQKAIAIKVDVREATLSKWVAEGQWETKRAGARVTRQELVNMNLQLIADILNNVRTADNPLVASKGVADEISKLAATIERLDKKGNVVNEIDAFISFNKWLQKRIAFDKALTADLLKAINKYQDFYIAERMSK
jgi:transposase-like protein